MAEDARNSRSAINDYTIIEDGDEGPFDVIELREEETLALDMLRIEYSSGASENIIVTLYDEEHDTDDVGDGDDIDAFWLEPGDQTIIEDATYSDVYRGLVASTDNDHDGDLVISAGGMKVTG